MANQSGSEIKKKSGKRWPKIFARVIVYLVAVFCIFFVGAFVSLQTQPVRDAIAQIIEKTIAQNTRAVCRIEELSGNLLSHFEVRGFELKNSKTNVFLMSADTIDVSYSIPMLLGRVLWVNRLTIDGVSVNLLQSIDGTWNFEMLASENSSAQLADKSQEPESFAYKVEIRRLLIRNSDVTITQQTDTDETIRHFNGIECQSRLDIGNDISAKINQLAVQSDNPHVDLKGLSGNIRYNFEEHRLKVKDVRIQGRKSDLTVNGLMRFFDTGPDMFNMDLRAAIKSLSLGEFGQAFPIQMPDEDIVSGNISVKGPVSKMDCRVDLRMDKCHVKTQGLVIIDDSNDVGPNTVSLNLTGKISSLDLSALPALDLKSFSSNLNTDFSLFWQRIGMPDQTGQINLDLTSSRMWGHLIDTAKLGVRIAGDDFIFENLQLETPYGKLDGSLILAGILSSENDNQIQFTADIEGFNPGTLVNDNQYAGSINGNVRSTLFIPKTFAIEGITAEAVCRINPSRMMDMDIRSADFEASLQDEKVIFKRFDLKTILGTVVAAGTALIKDKTCRLKASATLPDIKLIKLVIPDMAEEKELSGSVSVTADINGSWQGPDIKATVNGKKIVFRNVSADSLTADGHWKGGPKDFNVSAECSVQNIRSSGLQIPVLNIKTTMTPATIQANIELQDGQKEEFMLSGNISHWQEPEKHVIIDKMSLVSFDQPLLVNREPVKFSISRDRILVDSFYLDSGNASLVLKGGAGFNPPADVSADLTLQDFNLKRISGFWADGEKIQGSLSSEVKLSGLLENPVINMTASVKEAAYDEWPVTDMSVVLKYEDSKAQVTTSAYRKNKKLLDVNGTARMNLSLYPFEFLPTPGGIDFQMALDQVDVSWVSDIINDPEYDISGILNATASVSGDFFQPTVQGRAQLRDGALNLKKQKLIYENLVTDLKFAKNTITIDDISLEGDKEGSLHLSGILTYENFKPQTFNIRAVGKQFYIPFHSGVDVRINPDLTLSGTWEAPVLSGKIKVTEGRVNLERFLEKKLSEIQIVGPVAAENGVLQIPENEPVPLEFVDPLAADVAVIIPNDFMFKGEDEFVEIKGNIQLKKDPQKPFVLYGSVFPVRGTYRFRGRLFQITEGELMFTGQEDVNPSINIEAVSVIAEVKLIIRLTGTFEKINLILDSEPAMDQSEIISYLVFGRGPDDLSEKESFQAGEAALSFAGQIAADKLKDIVGDTLGIDYLNISAGSGGFSQGSLTMGKYVLPKVFVTFRQGFDETVTQKVEVTYEINKNFDLETQVDNEQTSALDLIWKYEY